MTTLLLSSRHTEDNQAIWRSAVHRGWEVERVQGIRLPNGLKRESEIVLYLESLFAPTVAAQLGITLSEPPEDWLVRLPFEYRHRTIQLSTLGEARKLTKSAFIKPPNDKSFQARIYETGNLLPPEFDDSQAVLVADPVRFDVEFRCFVANGKVKTLSPYLRSGQLARDSDFDYSQDERDMVESFTTQLLSDDRVVLPKAVVLDIGLISGIGWSVVELNSAWGSGLYGCDPDLVLDVVQLSMQS